MGLFDQIISAVNNPSQQANPDQIGGILNTVQQLSNHQGMNPSTTQTVMSLLGGYVRSSLQQQQQTGGYGQVANTVNQYGGTSPNPAAVGALFSPNQQQQVAQGISQRTGIDANLIISLLPVLVPIVLNLLKSGSQNQNAPMAQPGTNSGGNPVLNAFLDADRDGDVDLGDTLSMATQYFGRR